MILEVLLIMKRLIVLYIVLVNSSLMGEIWCMIGLVKNFNVNIKEFVYMKRIKLSVWFFMIVLVMLVIYELVLSLM